MQIYVNIKAAPGGDGSRKKPYRHINDAAKIAQPGDEVIVAPGVYREYVNPQHAGNAEHRIVYRSEKHLGAVITGAEEVKSWKPYQGNTWVARVDNAIFGDYNPYTTLVDGDWYFGGEFVHTGVVYLNDRMMYEAHSLEACLAGEPFAASWEPEYANLLWYTEQDGNETVLYANFQGKNPNEENVEINVRRECIMPDKKGVGYITISGFNVNKAATTWSPPAAYQDGAISAHWSKGWIIEDCDISNSRTNGICFGMYDQEDNNNYFYKNHVKSPTQMERESSCRAIHDGWSKETVGSHIVRRCNIHDCGQTGIVGRQGCVFSVIENNHIHHINNMQELMGAEIAGIKFHSAIDVIIRHNHIHNCPMGIWCDWQAQGTRITANLMHHNYPAECCKVKPRGFGQDIFVEVGHGPTLIDNNLLLSKSALRCATEGVAMVHNLCLGSLTAVGSGTDMLVDGVNQPRFTPYHYHHATDIMGFMTILHGDDRMYNNIFVQNWEFPKEDGANTDMGFQNMNNMDAGTFVFDEYPTEAEWLANFDFTKRADMRALMGVHFAHLPVWVNGNAYFNGAKACVKEETKLVDTENKVTVKLIEEDGHVRVETNVFDLLGDFHGVKVNTEVLGKAFEPSEYFETPDGEPIAFDEDYFRAFRAEAGIPGPFASAESAKLFVW